MTTLSYLQLPPYLTILLGEMGTGQSFGDELAKHYGTSAEFRQIINNVFSETIQKSGLSSLCKVLGNQVVRDKLILAYLNRLAGGSYHLQYKIQDIKDILWFEDIIRPYTTAGHWRHVLFAVYLKAIEVESGQPESHDNSLVVQTEKKIRPSMTFIKGKAAKIDWICLLIWQFIEILGDAKVSALLQSKSDYETMFKQLNEEEKRLLINNCMSYSMSIGDSDFFTSIILSAAPTTQADQ